MGQLTGYQAGSKLCKRTRLRRWPLFHTDMLHTINQLSSSRRQPSRNLCRQCASCLAWLQSIPWAVQDRPPACPTSQSVAHKHIIISVLMRFSFMSHCLWKTIRVGHQSALASSQLQGLVCLHQLKAPYSTHFQISVCPSWTPVKQPHD